MAYSCVRVVFEIGHEASIRTKCTPQGFTHDWEVFVRGADNTEIKHFVEKVVFYLHETFPKPKRVVKEPPYSVKESGYAGFNLPIEIYFKTVEEPKKVRFNYDLNLQSSGPSISRVQREKYVFRNPDEDLRPRLIRGGGVGVGSDAGTHSTTGEKPIPVPTIPSSADEASSKGATPQLVGKPKLGGDPGKKHKIKEHRSEEPRVSNSFQDLFGPPIKTAKVSPDPKKPSPSPKVSPLPKPAKPPDKSSSDKSVNITKPLKHNAQKDSREISNSSSSSSKEEKKDKNKDRDKSKEKTKHPTTPPKLPPSPPKVPSKPAKDEPKKTQSEESKGKSDSKSPGESSKSEKKKKDKRNKDEKFKKEKHKEHESKSNDKVDKGEKPSKESKDKDKDKDKDKEVSRKSEKDVSKETEKPKEREKSNDGEKVDKERSRHKHKKKERSKRDDLSKEKDRDKDKGTKKSSSDSKRSSDAKDKDKNGVSSESSKKRPRSPSHSPVRPSPSPKPSPVPEKPPPPPPPPVAKDKPAKRPLTKLFDELAQDSSSDSNLSPLSEDESIDHPTQLTRSPVPSENNKTESSVKPHVQNETQVTSNSSQVNNKLESSKSKTENANQERYSLSKISSNNNINSNSSTNISSNSSNNKQKDRSVSKKNKEKKESGSSAGKEESGSKIEKESSKKRKRKSSGKVKDDDMTISRVEAPAPKLPKLDPELGKSDDQGGQTSVLSSSNVEESSTVEEVKAAQVEDDPTLVSTTAAPTATNSSVQFSPDYVLQLKELQRKIMTLEDNAELQRVVQVIAETGQYEITKKTFDFDLCALDRSTVKRLQDFFTTS